MEGEGGGGCTSRAAILFVVEIHITEIMRISIYVLSYVIISGVLDKFCVFIVF